MPERAKEATSYLLANGLKKLMLEGKAFDKITIRDITDKAGVIRPTFYNHFSDKYELLGWIFDQEVLAPSYALLKSRMMGEALEMVMRRIDADRVFYRMAAKVEGQNGFPDMMRAAFFKWIMTATETLNWNSFPYDSVWLTREAFARYYANSLVFVVIEWINAREYVPVEDLMKIYGFIARNSVEDLFGGMRENPDGH